jgi:hypothetical protein
MGDVDQTGARWLTGIVAILLAGGGGIVALLNFFSAPVIETFEASPPEVAANGAVTLNWKAQASSVEISGIGTVGILGRETVRPKSTTTYTLVARKNWRTTVLARRVEVVRPPDRERGESRFDSGSGTAKTGASGSGAGSESAKADDSDKAIVVLSNDTDAIVAHVYFGTGRWGGWSGEQLSEAIPAGATHTWPPLQAGAGIYDLRAEDANHRVLDLEKGVSIRGRYEWHVDGRPKRAGD